MNPTASLRQLRIICFVFVIASILYAYSGEMVAGKSGGGGAGPQGITVNVIVFLAGIDVLIAYYFRRTKLYPALEKLCLTPNDPDALKSWRFSTLLTMILAESIALYGFALRFLGASRNVAVWFYLAALALLLVWRPKLDLPAGAADGAGNQ